MKLVVQIRGILISLLLLIGVLLPACIMALPFPLKRRLKIVCPVWGFCSRIILRYACQAQVAIKQDLRSPEFKTTPAAHGLYIANHQSFLDIPLVATVYQAPPIMKKEILFIPIFGWLGWISGALPVARSSLSSRRQVFERAKHRILKEDIGLQIYPEGTRSRDAVPKSYEQIKRALLIFAYNENIPIISTSVFGTRGSLTPKGFIVPHRKLGIIVHREIYPKDFDNADSFARFAWDLVLKGHEEMRIQLGPED